MSRPSYGAVSVERLDRPFFARPACSVARDLLGRKLVRAFPNGLRAAGVIVETEAYCNGKADDLACHGARNKGRPTARTAVMFGPPGFAYVYFNYGLHWLFNIVTGETGRPGAVLIRALEPVSGESIMATLRPGRPRGEWTNGPAKLTQALAIDGELDGLDICAPASTLWLEMGNCMPDTAVATGPRVGLGQTPEPWLTMPWRYWLTGNTFVSARRRKKVKLSGGMNNATSRR